MWIRECVPKRVASRGILASASALSLAALAAPAWSATTAGDTIEEVVVTAQKREENVQVVPASVQAISNAVIEAQGATSLQDLERAAPGVSFGDGSVFGRAGVRGVVDYSRNAGYDARVGVYIDGVFMGRSYMNNVALLDVDHVEVLRGPQGTLFGKNNDAGAVNIVTRAPARELTGKAVGEVGSFGFHSLSGYASGPVSETVSVALALSKVDSDGYYYNPVLKKHVNGVDRLSGRAQLAYRPNEDWDLRLSLDGQHYQDSTVHNPQAPAPGADPYIFNSPVDDREAHSNRGVTFTVSHEIGGGYSVTNIADYREAKESAYFTGQGNLNQWLIGDYHDSVHQFSEELRLTSPKTERYDYVAGLYYFRLNDHQDNSIDGGPDLVALGAPFSQYAGLRLPSLAHVDSDSMAAYVNGNLRITGRLELNGGLRYTRDHKTLDYSMLDPIQIILGYVAGLEDKQTFHKLTPKVGVSYHLSDDAMLYASYSEGFKSGGWNADFDTNNQIAAGIRVAPETARSGEIGIKSEFWGGRARLNVVGFYERFTDFQVFQLTLRTVGTQTVQQTSLTNAGQVTSKGVEFEGVVKPLPGLTLSANATYNRSRYDRFPGGGGTFQGQILSADGAQTPYAPTFKAYVAADLEQPVSGSLDMFAHVGVSTQTHTNSDAKYRNPTIGYIYKVDGWTVVDARLGLRPTNGPWEVSAWARNLFDKTYAYAAFGPTIGSFRDAKCGEPRSYGVTLSVEY